MTTWDVTACPLYCHQPHTGTKEPMKVSLLAPLLNSLENESQFDFLRGEPEFLRLLENYHNKE